MQYLLIALILFNSVWTKNATEPEPRVIFKFALDGVPVTIGSGAPARSKSLAVQWKLAEASEQQFPALKSQSIKGNCDVSLARGGRRIGVISWNWVGRLPMIGNAAPGDRLIIEMKDIQIHQPDGTWLKLSERAMPIYTIPLN